MRYNIFYLCVFFNILIFNNLFSQQKNIQPKIMVIPFTKSGQDMIQSYENNHLQRLVIARVKQGFETRNFPTVDFVSNIKMMSNDILFVAISVNSNHITKSRNTIWCVIEEFYGSFLAH